MVLKEVYRAKKNIKGWVRSTPLEHAPFLSDLCEGNVWLKLENLQITGSFKIRGALNKLLSLNSEQRGKGVVTASSGNHAQGLSYVAKRLGIRVVVVVPNNTPVIKIEAIKNYGVELNVFGKEYIEAEMRAREIAMSLGMTYVSPYNDLDIIAGQGTVGLEMLEENPCLDTIIVPVGGGGLISGIAAVVKKSSKAEVYGIQSCASPVMFQSIKIGKIIEMGLKDSYAEGLHGGIEKGSVTFDYCKKLVDKFMLVEEESILEAIKFCFKKHNIIIEGAGAVGISAILDNPDVFRERNVGIVVSGGNIEYSVLKKAVLE